MITEGDKIAIISGTFKGTIGRVQYKTGNGWYHIKIHRVNKIVRVRLVNLVPYRVYKTKTKTRGQRDGLIKDIKFDKKISNMKSQLRLHEKNLNTLATLPPGPKYNKLFLKFRVNARQLQSGLSFHIAAHDRSKKRTKRRLSPILE